MADAIEKEKLRERNLLARSCVLARLFPLSAEPKNAAVDKSVENETQAVDNFFQPTVAESEPNCR